MFWNENEMKKMDLEKWKSHSNKCLFYLHRSVLNYHEFRIKYEFLC